MLGLLAKWSGPIPVPYVLMAGVIQYLLRPLYGIVMVVGPVLGTARISAVDPH
jgi:hypothetical protein